MNAATENPDEVTVIHPLKTRTRLQQQQQQQQKSVFIFNLLSSQLSFLFCSCKMYPKFYIIQPWHIFGLQTDRLLGIILINLNYLN